MSLRKRIWTDSRVQGILVGRIVIYWLAVVLYFGTGIAVSQYCDQPDWTFAEHWLAWLATVGPWIPSTCLLLPLVIYDTIRTSHDFTGPIVRLRQQLLKLVQSPNCTPLVLREDDYWKELIGAVNTVQSQIVSMHLALQKQRETIDELRNGKKSASESSNVESTAKESKQTEELDAHRIAQVVEPANHSPEAIGTAS